MTRRWFALTSSLILTTALAASTMAQDSTTSHSFFGNWFGWRDGSSSQQNSRMNQSGNGVRQMTDTQGGSQQSSRYDQMPPDPAATQNDGLPGLGGSPLPRNSMQKTANGSPSKSAAATTAPSRAQTTRRNAVRQLDISAPAQQPRTIRRCQPRGNRHRTARRRTSIQTIFATSFPARSRVRRRPVSRPPATA